MGDGAGVVLRRDDLRAGAVEQLGRRRAHVAEALHRHPRALQVEVQAARGLAAGDEHAAPGGLDAPERATQVDRLAGDHAGGGGADVHRIGVHHPRHDLGVGVDVGRRDVLLRADDDADLAGVAPRQPLELLERQHLRVDADAALGAAVGQVDRRVLDRHPRRQRHHLVERDVRVVTHAALAGPARQVVLDAKALEVGHAAVVQLDRHVDDQRALAVLERLGPARQRPEIGHHAVHLREVGAPGAVGGFVNVGQFAHGLAPVTAIARTVGRARDPCATGEAAAVGVAAMRANAAPHSCARRAHAMAVRQAMVHRHVYTGPMNNAIRPEIAFVGGGNMASALIGGLLQTGRIPATVLVIEPDDRQRARLALQFGVFALPAADAHLDDVPLVVWAVKPQSFAAAARPCAPFVAGALQLSVMAGIRTEALMRRHRQPAGGARDAQHAGAGRPGHQRPVRHPAVNDSDRAAVEQVLAPSGELMWLQRERDLDAVTALSGSGPAYVYYFIEAMIQAAGEMGLTVEQGRRAGAGHLCRRHRAGATVERLARRAARAGHLQGRHHLRRADVARQRRGQGRVRARACTRRASGRARSATSSAARSRPSRLAQRQIERHAHEHAGAEPVVEAKGREAALAGARANQRVVPQRLQRRPRRCPVDTSRRAPACRPSTDQLTRYSA